MNYGSPIPPARAIARITKRYGIARDTYTARTRTDKLRLWTVDPYTVEIESARIATIARCLTASGMLVKVTGARTALVAA